MYRVDDGGQPHTADRTQGQSPSSMSGLTDELVRRLTLADQAQPSDAGEKYENVGLSYFCEPRHDADSNDADKPAQTQGIVSKWRQKERLKTTAVALVLCLNIGVDPPDVIKISPCARLECWVDPLSMQPPKALETIGKNLQAQYERWQPRAKYKMHLDPTMDDVKKLALSCRRTAKNERVLFHYNGHGVPRPTANGEIWVFNKSYTQYIPMSLYDLQAWVSSPAIYVFDCSAAGLIVNSFKSFAAQRGQELEGMSRIPAGAYGLPDSGPSNLRDPMKETILLAACGPNELLPQNPELPADVFTSCLTTPIKVALRWFCSRSLLRHEGLTKELIDRIPGKQTDRKTPLGELNWIFTAITDTIAWNMLPRPLFQKLFRQDLLVASLFRNFLLAERIMRAATCAPVSYPRLPATHQHPMWQAWDMAAEMCLLQLPALLHGDNVEFQPSNFFSEQLTAFELWLEHGSKHKRPPEQLPIVLQVLLSQVHRLRALVLLGRFLDMGSWAVDLALSVGIFPYVLKLLQTTAADLRQTLVFIWTKILALDKSCQVDLVKDNGHLYFIKYLESSDPTITPDSRAQAAFILAVICDGHPRGQQLCAQSCLLPTCLQQLPGAQAIIQSGGSELLMKWLLLCIGKLCEDNPENTAHAMSNSVPEEMAKLLSHDSAEVRAAAVFALGALVQASEGGPMEEGGPSGQSPIPEAERMAAERATACHLLQVVYDGSPLVRAEVAAALGRIASGHALLFQDAVHAVQKNTSSILENRSEGRGLWGARSAPSTTMPPPGFKSRGGDSAGPPSAGATDRQQHGAANGIIPKKPTSAAQPTPSKSWSQPSSPISSPGVRQAPGSIGFEPVLHVGIEEGHPTAGVFASPDAARVGGGLYSHILEAVCTLATDPAPRVAQLAQGALHVAHVELVELPLSRGASALALQTATSAPLSHLPPTLSSQSSVTPALVTATSLATKLASTWNRHSPGKAAATASKSTNSGVAGSPTTSPTGGYPIHPSYCARAQFILRRVHQSSQALHQSAAHRVASSTSVSSEYDTVSSVHGDASEPGTSAFAEEQRPRINKELPQSVVYSASCNFFSWPLLPSQAGGWIDDPALDAPPHSHWCEAVDPAVVAARKKERADMVRAITSTSRDCTLRKDVISCHLDCSCVNSVCFDPFSPLITGVDGHGIVRVMDYKKMSIVNRFHVASGSGLFDRKSDHSVVSIVSLHHLNELHQGVLMACAADGAVRVWRDHQIKGKQRLATAWQAAPVAHGVGAVCRPTTYHYSAGLGALFAAGGSQPSAVHWWDLERELCLCQVQVPCPPSGSGNVTVDHIVVSRNEPLLLAGCDNGTVYMYDLRAADVAVASLRVAQSSLSGLVVEPGGNAHSLVAGSVKGNMTFCDFRMVGDGTEGSMGMWKTVEAHSKGNMSAMAAHPYVPLIATGTTNQVVKLWSPQGDQLGVCRTNTSLLQRLGPITCLAFHPYRLQLASAGGDSVVALYNMNTTESSSHTSTASSHM